MLFTLGIAVGKPAHRVMVRGPKRKVKVLKACESDKKKCSVMMADRRNSSIKEARLGFQPYPAHMQRLG